MIEGEFKKRVRELAEDIWNDNNFHTKEAQASTMSFSISVEGWLDEARKKFPSCEVCSFDIDKLDHNNPPSNCYKARHQYPSKCPKNEWFKKWFGSGVLADAETP